MATRLAALEAEHTRLMERLSHLAALQEDGDELAETEGVVLMDAVQDVETEIAVERTRQEPQ